jgi:hypothetical protein
MLSFGSPLHSSGLVGNYCLRQETEKLTVCPSTQSIPHLNLDTSRIRSSHHLCIRQDTVPAQNMVYHRFRHLNFYECLSYCHAFLRASQKPGTRHNALRASGEKYEVVWTLSTVSSAFKMHLYNSFVFFFITLRPHQCITCSLDAAFAEERGGSRLRPVFLVFGKAYISAEAHTAYHPIHFYCPPLSCK